MQITKTSWILIRGGITFCSVSVFCFLPFLLLLFLGVQDRTNRNNNLVETTCTIENHFITVGICTESCNCITTCTPIGETTSCTTRCQTCEYTCYDGFITLEHRTSNDLPFRDDVEVYPNRRSETSVENDLNNEYMIGSEIACFYESDNPSEIRLELHDVRIFLGFAITFVILGGLILFCWIAYELTHFFYPNVLPF